jgi:DAK2 domain
MDRITGDADLGASMKRAATAIQESLESYPLDDIPATVKALGHTLRQELAGSSGPLYGVLFLQCGNVLEQKGANWRSGPKQSKRAAVLSANWVVPNQAIGRCWMLSIHL